MSRCENLRRTRTAGAALAALLGASMLLVSCGGSSSDPEPPPSSQGVVYEAGPNDLPEFRRYVVGEMPEPPAGSRDPFRDESRDRVAPTSKAPARRVPHVHFQLHGIVERQGERVALLGRGSVRVGESVAGWTVREIGPREVLLVRGDRERRLSL